ncbi:MAG: TonB-dependent receptor [Ignavibacteria bacterium]|nr:TonB-dependent receptor [Ignavibacteria bacterium]
MVRLMIQIVLILGFPSLLYSQQEGTVEGRVVDSETQRVLEGANVLLQGTAMGTSTNVHGQFALQSIPPGRYLISVSYVGYEVQKKGIDIQQGKTTSVVIELVPSVLPGQMVIVTATRARERETPVAFSTLDAKEIANRYWAQDVPMLLSELPNVYSYSDNGNGIGYSYMKMRGFGQNRIGVMLNGVPLNDAESHEVFWVDLPDVATSTEDIQVQRGVGRSFYGASAFGGSVNLVTSQSVRKPGIEISLGGGSYNTKRYSVSGRSGLSENTYSIYARFSRIETDGYRRPSWSKLWSYFVAVSRYDETMTTRLNVFGGIEQSYLSYLGVTKSELADSEKRKVNPFQYPEEIDNFHQPHFQLSNEWQITPAAKMENTLFAFLGFGHYTQFRARRDLREYNMSRFIIRDSTLLPSAYLRNVDKDAVRDSFQVRNIDLVRKRSVDDLDFGWLPRFTLKTEQGEWVIGAEIRRHRGHHWGEVLWANLLPPGVTPNWRYYDYRVPKTSISLYAHRLYRVGPSLTLTGDVQLTRHVLDLTDERNFNVTFNRTYTFLNPRIGANYNVTEQLNAYLNFSVAQREPAFKTIHNPQDYWTNPINLPKNFQKTASGYAYVGKEVKPEKFFHLELGSGYRTDVGWLKANLYWMDFRDEIIASGQIDDNGVPIAGNAERTVHRGIELEGSVCVGSSLTLSGNVAANDDRFIRHTEYVVTDWNTVPPITAPIRYNDNRLGGFPTVLGNVRAAYNVGGLLLGIQLQHVGRVYLDNSEREELSVEPVTVVNASLEYAFADVLGFRSLALRANVNNLASKLYAAAGYVDTGVPYLIPAADRNYFASITIEL